MVDDCYRSRYKICPNLRHLNIRAKGINDCDINGSRHIGLGLDEFFLSQIYAKLLLHWRPDYKTHIS